MTAVRHFPAILSTLLWLANHGWAQVTSEQPGTFRLDVNLVLVQAAVTDHGGHPISGLEEKNFGLQADGISQMITSFKGEDVPVTLGIVVDHSASMIPKSSEVIAGALALGRASNPQDEMFVVNFNERVVLGLTQGKAFTGDPAELKAALTSFPNTGKTALYDAVELAIQHLEKATLLSKVLVLISDGGDTQSQTTLKQVLDAAVRSGAAIYTIGIFDESDEDKNPKILKKLADVSGGRAFLPYDIKEITQICDRIAKDVRSRYTVGFAPAGKASEAGYHTIRLTAHDSRHRNLTVHARPGYFAGSHGTEASESAK